jgi:hypothetical protein
MRWPIMRYSQEHTSNRFAAHAASSATVSTICTRSPDDLKVVAMMGKTSGDSGRRVSGIIFRLIQDSFTTQGFLRLNRQNRSETAGKAHDLAINCA